MSQLLKLLRFDFAFFATDNVEFIARSWETEYWSAHQSHGIDHFSFVPNSELCAATTAGICEATIEAVRSSSFFTFTPRLLESSGFCDATLGKSIQVSNLVQRWRRLTGSKGFVDVSGSDKLIQLRDDKVTSVLVDLSAPPLSASYPQLVTAAKITLYSLNVYPSSKRTIVWNLFERTFVVSRSSTPWKEIEPLLTQLNVVPSRFTIQPLTNLQSMITKRDSDVIALSKRSAPALTADQESFKFTKLKTELEFYEQSPSEGLRVQYWLGHLKENRRTAAMGGLNTNEINLIGTWIAMISKAMKRRHEALLILEDTVQVHRNFRELITTTAKSVSADWVMIYLGGKQRHWESEWVAPLAQNVVLGQGGTLGSFAVLIRDTIFVDLLHHLSRGDLPVDVGALSAVCRTYRTRCFTVTPSIFIMPEKGEGEDDWAQYRWDKPSAYHRTGK